jgi:hypothetical protein
VKFAMGMLPDLQQPLFKVQLSLVCPTTIWWWDIRMKTWTQYFL